MRCRRLAAGAAVGTALVLSLAGCFGSNSGGSKLGGAQLSAAQVLDQTSQKTGQANTFKANLSMDGAMSGQNMKMTGTMQYQSKPVAFSMTIDQMNAGGRTVGGMQQILVGDTMYVKLPAAAAQATGAKKPWIKVSLTELGNKTGMNLQELLKQSEQMNPVTNTKMFTSSKDAREVGKETIDGVETTHFTGTYSMKDAVAKLDPKARDTLGKVYEGAGVDKMSFDIWVDGQQLPRKIAVKTPSGAQMQMAVTMTFRDFGQPVNVSAPPADQVGDMPSMPAGTTPN